MILGIDPGLSGALALLTIDGSVICHDMPVLALPRAGKLRRDIDSYALADWLRSYVIDEAFIEQLWGMPAKPGSKNEARPSYAAQFAMGKAYGQVLGVITTLRIPLTMISAQRWKKEMQVTAAKDGSRARASQLLPSAAAQWARVKDHNRAEATLIALYGKREIDKRSQRSA